MVNSNILLRIGRYVEHRLAASIAIAPQLPHRTWARLTRAYELVELCQRRGWQVAAKSCRERYFFALAELRRQAVELEDEVRRQRTPARASLADIYDDLLALQSEFEGVMIDLREKTIAVDTPPVNLEGVELGSFTILLEAGELASRGAPYRVVARDPYSSAADSEVTHPHVRDEKLCEGEAHTALRASLASGRLLDFFTVVAQTLATYNPGSTDAALDSWSGAACDSCGDTVDHGDRVGCEQCEKELCLDCSLACSECSRSICSDCSTCCHDCGSNACPCCWDACAHCRNSYCKGCLDDQLCSDCREAAHEGDVALSSPAVVAAEPLRLAQLLALRDFGSTEIGGFGIAEPGDPLLIRDVRLVSQECDWASVSFDDLAVADFFDEQVDAGRAPEEFARVWIHTHPGNSTSPSATDEATFWRVFGGCDWSVMFILAAGGGTYARLQYSVGPGGSLVLPVEVEYAVDFAASDRAAWRAEYECCVRVVEVQRAVQDGMFVEELLADRLNGSWEGDKFWSRLAWEEGEVV